MQMLCTASRERLLMKLKDHFALLGFTVRDVVSGYEGVAESISFDLYGCVQIAIRPPAPKPENGKMAEYPDGRWFDAKRLKGVSLLPVMEVPTFETEPGGPADKPPMRSSPLR